MDRCAVISASLTACSYVPVVPTVPAVPADDRVRDTFFETQAHVPAGATAAVLAAVSTGNTPSAAVAAIAAKPAVSSRGYNRRELSGVDAIGSARSSATATAASATVVAAISPGATVSPVAASCTLARLIDPVRRHTDRDESAIGACDSPSPAGTTTLGGPCVTILRADLTQLWIRLVAPQTTRTSILAPSHSIPAIRDEFSAPHGARFYGPRRAAARACPPTEAGFPCRARDGRGIPK